MSHTEVPTVKQISPIRNIVALIGGMLLMGSSIQLYRLPLWNWWTCAWLFGWWALVIALRWKQFNKRWLVLSSLSGFLLTLGFPIIPTPATLFIAIAFLLQVEHEIAAVRINGEKNKSTRFSLYAYNTFVIWNIGVTWWVANAGLAVGCIANFLNAFFMMGVFWMVHRLTRNLYFYNRPVLKFSFFAVAWMSFEYLHLHWDISWSWLNLGNAFAAVPLRVQWYEYTGIFGGTLWVWVANIAAWRLAQMKKILLQHTAIFISILFMPAIISFLIYFPEKINFQKNQNALLNFENEIKNKFSKTDSAKNISALEEKINFEKAVGIKKFSVAVVQPNIEPHYEKFKMPDEAQLQKFLHLSESIVDSTTDYLVYPETSFDLHNIANLETNTDVSALKNLVHLYPKLNLVMGVDALRIYQEYTPIKKPNKPFTVREFKNPEGTFTYWEAYNAATQINNGISPMPLYKKSKFVPGAEIFPYPPVFSLLLPLFEKFGGSLNGLGSQPERSVFTSVDGSNKVGPVICYESIFGEYCTDYVKNGADALFIVTNDGWWHTTPGYQQHADFARLRAIELRRPVVRSANTGRSCFIDIFGNETQGTRYGVEAAIKQTIYAPNTLTFYAQHGDYLARMALVGTALFMVLAAFKFRRP